MSTVPAKVKQPSVPTTIAALRKELRAVTTPAHALDIVSRAARAKRVFEAIGHSVEECNQFAEIYLAAYWKFGDFAADIERGRPRKTGIDAGFPGTEKQRTYARTLRNAVAETDIPKYVLAATSILEAASIAGCLEWMDPGRHGHLKGGYEWYTPAALIEAARAVMGGGIDLDPASCAHAQAIVKATEYYTEADDGLAQIWHGRVFLNPPFAHPTVQYFAEKLLASPDVLQAVWLSNACVDTAWWQALAAKGIVCCHLGRVKFYGPEGQLQPPTLGQTIIYLGPQRDQFRTQFAPFGVVLS
jgi:hypothetical protein